MSKVYQCDVCGRIFEPRTLKSGEPYVTTKNGKDLDLCPECYGYLLEFLSSDIDESKCITCKYNDVNPLESPCKECCHEWGSKYERGGE